MNDFSVVCNVIQLYFTHIELLVKLEQSSQTLSLHYKLNVCNILKFLLSSTIFTINSFHLKEHFLCSSIKSTSSFVQALSCAFRNAVTSLGSTSRLLTFLPFFALNVTVKPWTLQSWQSCQFFQTPFNVDILTFLKWITNVLNGI